MRTGWSPKTEGAVDMFAIYERPRDAPGRYIIRRWELLKGQRGVVACEARQTSSLDAARMTIPEGRVLVPRQPGDDPVIVETWV